VKQYPGKKDWKFRIAIIIIIVLMVIIAGILINPQIQGYVVKKQTEAYNFAVTQMVSQMLQEIQQQGYTQINIGNNSLILVPYQPTQQPQPLQ